MRLLPPPAAAERLRVKAAAVAAESAEAAALQKQVAAQERELARQAMALARESAEGDVRAREAGKQLNQVRGLGGLGGRVCGQRLLQLAAHREQAGIVLPAVGSQR